MRFLRYKTLKSVMGPGRVGPGREYSDFSLKFERTRSARNNTTHIACQPTTPLHLNITFPHTNYTPHHHNLHPPPPYTPPHRTAVSTPRCTHTAPTLHPCHTHRPGKTSGCRGLDQAASPYTLVISSVRSAAPLYTVPERQPSL